MSEIVTKTSTTASLPDRAIGAQAEDFLNRSSFAYALADQVLHAPTGQTLRIGVYGGWGEGKTSVLALMQRRLHEKGQICLWIAPWAAQTRDEVLGNVIKQLAETFKIDASALTRATTTTSVVTAVRTAAGEATWWSKGGAALFGPALQKHFDTKAVSEIDRFFEAVNEKLEGRRVVVFIDDLDRVRSEFIAELLLTLREALDQPNFFYVMALAPEVVQRGLQTHHGGWRNATEFLEKIIEFPRHLPAPTDRDIDIFIQRSTAILGTAIDADVLRAIAHLLPRNPRKLKLFLRFMASLSGLIARFDPTEIDLTGLYTIQLLRSEFPEETRLMIENLAVIEDLEHGSMFERMNRNQKEDVTSPAPSSVYLHDSSDRMKSRFDLLYNAIRHRGALDRGRYGVRSLFTLPDSHPLVTWKELNAFMIGYHSAATVVRAETLRTFVTVEEAIDARRAEAVFSLVIEMREAVLSRAADAHIDDDRKLLTVEAAGLTDVISRFITDLNAFATPLFGVSSWKALFQHFQKWAHFTKLPEYDALRAEERRLLSTAADTMTIDLRIAVLETLGSVTDFHGHEGATFMNYVAELKGKLQLSAAERILSLFTTADGLESFWGDRGSRATKDILFRPDSVLFANASLNAKLTEIAKRSSADIIVQRNFVQYTRMLLYGAIEAGSFGREECRTFLRNTDVMSVIWRAAVARPLNPRITGGLRENRDRIITAGVLDRQQADAVLAIPAWWQDLEQSFFKSG